MIQSRKRTSPKDRPATLSFPDHLAVRLESYIEGLEYGEDEYVAPLREAMRYSLLAGGKRVRPVLLMATGAVFGGDPQELLPTAAALEMIHTYSLIHDDLPAFDDDNLRRGKPTCHVRYGESVAILAGDALFAEAFRLICQKQQAAPAAKLAVMEEVAVSTGVKGMVGGQFLDVYGIPGEGPDTVRLLHSLKTGRLIMACVRCGAILSGAPEEQTARLTAFAAELGLLFQIKDDILDVVGETVELGKQAGTDARLDRHTYVSVYGLRESERLAAESREKALAELGQVRGETVDLAGITNYIYERRR
ncbi:MAG TPA: polyprenyl synthetase family protein [Actinobacteria bacterium]|nr:polyprenyl synthetase family protein [Actinomycetota bacterium]